MTNLIRFRHHVEVQHVPIHDLWTEALFRKINAWFIAIWTFAAFGQLWSIDQSKFVTCSFRETFELLSLKPPWIQFSSSVLRESCFVVEIIADFRLVITTKKKLRFALWGNARRLSAKVLFSFLFFFSVNDRAPASDGKFEGIRWRECKRDWKVMGRACRDRFEGDSRCIKVLGSRRFIALVEWFHCFD